MMTHRSVAIGLAAAPLIAAKHNGDGDIQSILGYIVVGAIVGIVARLLIKGTGGMSWILTIVVGIIGAVLGGWLAGNVFEDTGGVDWIASILVAALLTWVVARSTTGRGRAF